MTDNVDKKSEKILVSVRITHPLFRPENANRLRIRRLKKSYAQDYDPNRLTINNLTSQRMYRIRHKAYFFRLIKHLYKIRAFILPK